MAGLPIILIVVAALAIAVVVYLSYLAAKRRREVLAALAGELGWRFDPSRDRSHDDEYAHFEIFRQGHSRAAYNTLAGDPPTVDIEAGRCCLSDGRHRWSPEEFGATLSWVIEFFDRWPDHVTAELAS